MLRNNGEFATAFVQAFLFLQIVVQLSLIGSVSEFPFGNFRNDKKKSSGLVELPFYRHAPCSISTMRQRKPFFFRFNNTCQRLSGHIWMVAKLLWVYTLIWFFSADNCRPRLIVAIKRLREFCLNPRLSQLVSIVMSVFCYYIFRTNDEWTENYALRFSLALRRSKELDFADIYSQLELVMSQGGFYSFTKTCVIRI